MNQEKQQSPLPKKNIEVVITQFSFPNVVAPLMKGKKIHKLEWKNKEIYGVMHEGILRLKKEDGEMYNWILNDGDLEGTDYIILD